MTKNEIDNELVRKFVAEKDDEAFAELAKRHHQRIGAICYRFVGSENVDDVRQDALLHLYKKLHTYQRRSQFTTWLHRVVANVCMMWKRQQDITYLHKHGMQMLSLDAPLELENGSGVQIDVPVEDVDMRAVAARKIVHELIEEMDTIGGHRYAAVLRYHVIDGFQFKEIAVLLGISIGAVKSYYSRGIVKMRKKLNVPGHEQYNTSGHLIVTRQESDRRSGTDVIRAHSFAAHASGTR